MTILQRSIRAVQVVKWLLSMAVVLNLAVAMASFVAPRTEARIDSSKVGEWPGLAFNYPVSDVVAFPYVVLSDGNGRLKESNLTLSENGAPLGPAHSLHQQIEDVGGGAYSHWGNKLIFSSSDGSDPRANGRTYTIDYRAVLDLRIVSAARWTNALLVLLCLWRTRRAAKGPALGLLRYLAGKRDRLPAFAVAALPPAVVSLFLFAYLPPTWNGSDSSGFLFMQLGYVPHYAILYPQIMDIAIRAFGPSAGLMVFVQLLQHALLIASISYLASSESRVVSRLALAVVASIGAALNLYAHGIFTEGLALPFLIFQVGAFIRIVKVGWSAKPALLVYHVALLLSMWTRHNFILFGAILPLYAAITVLGGGDSVMRRVRSLVLSSALLLSVLVVGQALEIAYCNLIDRPSASILGEAGSYRMLATGNMLSEAERQRFIQRLQSQTDDPAVRFAIERMVLNQTPWLPTYEEITASPLVGKRNVDDIMNSAFVIFLRTYDPASLAEMKDEFVSYFFPAMGMGKWVGGAGQFSLILANSVASLSAYQRDDRTLAVLGDTGFLTSPLIYRYQELLDCPLVRVLDGIPPGYLAVLLCALVSASSVMGWGRRESAYGALALLGAGLVYALGSAVATVAITRYLEPLNFVLWVGIGSTVIEIVRGVTSRSYVDVQTIGS
jgi:hypothetical protein